VFIKEDKKDFRGKEEEEGRKYYIGQGRTNKMRVGSPPSSFFFKFYHKKQPAKKLVEILQMDFATPISLRCRLWCWCPFPILPFLFREGNMGRLGLGSLTWWFALSALARKFGGKKMFLVPTNLYFHSPLQAPQITHMYT